MLSKKAINWFALAAGVLMLVEVALSIFVPWWKLQIGSGTGFVTVNANPFYTNFGVLRLNFVIPILFAINVATTALFTASGIIFIIYSVKPVKSYSKHLLSYGWKRPVYTLVGFIVVLMLIVYVAPDIVNTMAHTSMIHIPLVGSSVMQISSNVFGNSNSVQIGITVIATFEYTFYLAIAATALGIAARIYHRRIVSKAVISPPAAVITPIQAPTPAPASQPI
ncbi:MAG TPA: hypothetical protein VK536_02595 [Candidatus Limnocylindrales bacterium]|nr:hypothetical protein [Candidatus Limnocylindrales bacterium]